jgi:hypothetical protein
VIIKELAYRQAGCCKDKGGNFKVPNKKQNKIPTVA